MNTSSDENFIRSAKAPTISAGVMQAKVIWKAMKVYSGSQIPLVKVGTSVVASTPARNILEKPPT
jgi:hypothetical protein